MYIEPHIDISIDSIKYEQILNNVLIKAPIEIGVEIAVYMVLFGLLENTDMVVCDVNTMWKSKAEKYSNNKGKKLGAVPDLVIVDKSFSYSKPSQDSSAYGFVEVKSLACSKIKEDGEIESHKIHTNNFLWTNGKIWHYFNKLKPEQNWEVDLCNTKIKDGSIHIDGLKYGELLYRLKNIDWKGDN